MLLLIGEAKYKFILGGEQRTFWVRNSKTSYQNEYSLPNNNCVTFSVVDECNTKCSQHCAKIKSFKNQKDRLSSTLPLFAAFHGVEEVI